MQIDSIVGRLFEKLRELHLDKNTIVIFTSDNGPWYEGSSGPLRDRKGGSGYDGGYRVPFIAWAPGLIPVGKTNAIITGLDILPTLCHFANLPLPQGVELDGLDISAVLTKHAPSPHDQLTLFNNEEVVVIRTQQWKYVDQIYQRGNIVTFGNSKYKHLYDTVNDIHESYSLSDRHPDVTATCSAASPRPARNTPPSKSASRSTSNDSRKPKTNMTNFGGRVQRGPDQLFHLSTLDSPSYNETKR